MHFKLKVTKFASFKSDKNKNYTHSLLPFVIDVRG
jgi:hypothetical protein